MERHACRPKGEGGTGKRERVLERENWRLRVEDKEEMRREAAVSSETHERGREGGQEPDPHAGDDTISAGGLEQGRSTRKGKRGEGGSAE